MGKMHLGLERERISNLGFETSYEARQYRQLVRVKREQGQSKGIGRG
jgi:hypothetical protein